VCVCVCAYIYIYMGVCVCAYIYMGVCVCVCVRIFEHNAHILHLTVTATERRRNARDALNKNHGVAQFWTVLAL